MSEDLKLLSLKFLVCCYFGQSSDLINAAVDRAYVDMAAHTIHKCNFPDDDTKWECRYEGSSTIKVSLRDYPCEKNSFDEWHRHVIKGIKTNYKDYNFTEGQAHKWLNMTIKYLYILKQLLGDDFDGKDCKDFFDITKVEDYKIPIDSYILKGSGVGGSWSNFIGDEDNNEDNKKDKYQDKYKDVIDTISKDKCHFVWELEKWEEYANKYSEKSDYEKYLERTGKSI